MRVVWSPLAIGHVVEIAEDIGQDRPHAAEAWVEEIFAAVQRLEQLPESGRMVPEIRRREIREVIHGNYRILYRVEPDQVSVLTVRHSRQLTSREDIPG